MWWLVSSWLVSGCGGGSTEPPAVEPPEESLPEIRAYRLTDPEYRATVREALDIDYGGPLPGDYVLHGYRSVGAGAVSVSPRELELYEAAAWSIAHSSVPDDASVEALLGCQPLPPLGHPADPDRVAPCVGSGLAPLASAAWRRPVTQTELDRLVGVWSNAVGPAGPAMATRAAVAALLLAPEFLYRIEVGEPDPDIPGGRRFTSWELASRLSYFLVDGPPDAPLRADAERGVLTDPEVLVAHAGRLYATPAARAALGRFWEETLELDRLDFVTKDAAQFPEFDASLREAMKVEMRELFEHVVFETSAPFGTLLTTDVTFVDGALGSLYGVAAVGSATMTRLPDGRRGGILGRAAPLAIWSHATETSPTLRGKFVRTRMLCQAVPPPPEGVVASLDEVGGEGPARERLAAHSESLACRGCHEVMDPPGLAFEHFDAVGRWRDDDGGYAIDPSGELDGVAFADARELGAVVASHPEFAPCMALQLFRHAMGTAEQTGQLPAIRRLGDAFEESGQSLEALVLALVASEPFLRGQAPEGGTSDRCGSGVEVCNGIDDDCDGDVDEDVALECLEDDAIGISDCSLATCVLPAPDPEQCNGADDDGDGDVDEGGVLVTTVESAASAMDACATGCRRVGFPTSLVLGSEQAVACVADDLATTADVTYETLAGYHEACTSGEARSPCNAAIHRMCSDWGHDAGFGPVAGDETTASVVCLDGASVVRSSYTELERFDPDCTIATRLGSSCHRAIHSLCQSEGFASGFGPLENSGDTAVVACIGEVP